MNEELERIKEAVGSLPKKQKQDRVRQACAGLCAANSASASASAGEDDDIVKLRRKMAKENNISEETAATALNQMILLQSNMLRQLGSAHKQIISQYDEMMRRNNVPALHRKKVICAVEMSVVYNLCAHVERNSPGSKKGGLADKLLEVIRSADGFVTVNWDKAQKQSEGK